MYPSQIAKGGPANGGRSRIPIQGNSVPYRHGSSRAIQGDFLVVIAAQGHGVIQGDLVVHRSVCGIRSSFDFVFAPSPLTVTVLAAIFFTSPILAALVSVS